MKIISVNWHKKTEIYLRKLFYGKYVVVVCGPCEENFDYVNDTVKSLFPDEQIINHLLNDDFYIICDNKKEGFEVFKKFPEEKASYALLFGPIDFENTTKKYRDMIYEKYSEEEIFGGVILSENT